MEDCDRGNALLVSVKTEAMFPCAHAAAVQRRADIERGSDRRHAGASRGCKLLY